MRNALAAFLLVLVGITGTAFAQGGGFYDVPSNRLALRGYDPVGYQSQQRPVLGSEENSADVDGITYWFASKVNRDKFVSHPGDYAPQFGGFCATGVHNGAKIEADPQHFAVVDGKLYLFQNAAARERFMRDQQQSAKVARDKWAEVSGLPTRYPNSYRQVR